MNAREFRRLIKNYWISELPGFELQGGWLYAVPFHYLVRWIVLSSSAWNRYRLFVDVGVQALYVPREFGPCNQLGFGRGLQGPEHKPGVVVWDLTPNNEAEIMGEILQWVQTDGVPFLETVRTLEDYARTIQSFQWYRTDFSILEELAYAQVLLGQTDEARQTIKLLEQAFSDFLGSTPPEYMAEWHFAVRERARRVAAALDKSPETAVEILNGWRDLTLKSLRLR